MLSARSVANNARLWGPSTPCASHVGPRKASRPAIVLRAGPDGMDDLDQQLKDDMDRMRQQQAAAGSASAADRRSSSFQPQSIASSRDPEPSSPLGGVKDAVEKVLIADFFFIVFALAWLAAGVVSNSTLHNSALLDTWLSLWQWVFQPAIGVLMLGAIVSGAVGWANNKMSEGNKGR